MFSRHSISTRFCLPALKHEVVGVLYVQLHQLIILFCSFSITLILESQCFVFWQNVFVQRQKSYFISFKLNKSSSQCCHCNLFLKAGVLTRSTSAGSGVQAFLVLFDLIFVFFASKSTGIFKFMINLKFHCSTKFFQNRIKIFWKILISEGTKSL